MNLDYSHKQTGELENLVRNYRAANKTEDDVFICALRELELRRTKGLDLQKTLDLVIEAAKEQRYVSYKDVASRSDCEWSKVFRQIGGHLDRLCEYAHNKKLPLLSAIVVNAAGVANGTLKPVSEAGFLTIARQLGYQVLDEGSFVKAEQERVFDRFRPEQHR